MRITDSARIILYILKRWATNCGLITPSFPEDNFLFLVMLACSGEKMGRGETIMDAVS